MSDSIAPTAPEQYHGSVERTRAVTRVLWITLILNWGMAGLKVVIGLVSGNVTVLADGFHSLLDGANNVVGLVAVRLAGRPPDAEHPYGHRKFENAASMIIGGAVMLLAWETLETVIQRVLAVVRKSGDAVGGRDAAQVAGEHFSWYYVAAVSVALLVSLTVSAYEKRAGERLNSPLLTADATHTRADALVNGLGILSLLLARHAWWIDPLLAAVVVVMLIRGAWAILDDSILAFTERQRLDPAAVQVAAGRVPGVLNTHAIRSHGTANDLHLDLHVVVRESLTAKETAVIEEQVRQTLLEAFPAVTHVAIHHQTEEHDPSEPVWKET